MKSQKRQKIIQKKIKELRERYEETRSLNEFAGVSHGSELSLAEMLEKEIVIYTKACDLEKILKEIKKLEKLLARPEIDMNDKLLKQKKEETLSKINAIETKEEKLLERRENIEKFLTLIKSILEIK